MNVDFTKDGAELSAVISGRLDTTTSPDFEAQILPMLEGVENLTLDCSELQYVSSAGLRVIITLQKRMNKQGKMVLKEVNDAVMEVLKMTGFTEILTIE